MIDEQSLIKMSGDVKTVFKSPDFRSLPGQISNVVMATNVCPTQQPLPGKLFESLDKCVIIRVKVILLMFLDL